MPARSYVSGRVQTLCVTFILVHGASQLDLVDLDAFFTAELHHFLYVLELGVQVGPDQDGMLNAGEGKAYGGNVRGYRLTIPENF